MFPPRDDTSSYSGATEFYQNLHATTPFVSEELELFGSHFKVILAITMST